MVTTVPVFYATVKVTRENVQGKVGCPCWPDNALARQLPARQDPCWGCCPEAGSPGGCNILCTAASGRACMFVEHTLIAAVCVKGSWACTHRRSDYARRPAHCEPSCSVPAECPPQPALRSRREGAATAASIPEALLRLLPLVRAAGPGQQEHRVPCRPRDSSWTSCALRSLASWP